MLSKLIQFLVVASPVLGYAPTDPYNLQCMQMHQRPGEKSVVQQGVKFNPDIHLTLEQPAHLMDLNFEKVDYPLKADVGLAYAAPTKIMSEEGLSVLRSIIHGNKHKATRHPRGLSLAALAYESQFVHDMIYNEKFLEFVSAMANEPLCPHTLGMHVAHVNFGKIDPNYEADKWHFDSVGYVLVIVLSDVEGMDGGNLEVLKMDLGSREAVEALRQEGGPPSTHTE